MSDIDYGLVNPPVWECVEFQGFLLVQEHLDRLLEIRSLREEIDPDFRWSVLIGKNGMIIRDKNGRPRKGQLMRRNSAPRINSYVVMEGAVLQPCLLPEAPDGMDMRKKLTALQLAHHRIRWHEQTLLEY